MRRGVWLARVVGIAIAALLVVEPLAPVVAQILRPAPRVCPACGMKDMCGAVCCCVRSTAAKCGAQGEKAFGWTACHREGAPVVAAVAMARDVPPGLVWRRPPGRVAVGAPAAALTALARAAPLTPPPEPNRAG